MSSHAAMVFLHWFWTAFFVLFGVFMMTRGHNYLSACSADCFMKVKTDDEDARNRIRAAMKRREDAEGAPFPLGVWLGSFSIVLGAVAATGRVQPALLYAFLCLGMAAGSALVFLRIRNSQSVRVAVLSARSSDSVIPVYWFAIACVSALAVLTYTANPQYRGAAVIVTLSSLLTVAIAWRLTNLPALLTGVDVSAEQIVDGRLRFFRSRAAMVFAVVQTFVFCSQAVGQTTNAEFATYLFTTVVWAAFAVWMLRRQFAAIQLA